ncbi:MAG: MopE-related protein [Persicimonas sp.]
MFLGAAFLVTACGSDDSSGGDGESCPAGEIRNDLTGECEPAPDQGLDAGSDSADSSSRDSDGHGGGPDNSPDADPQPDTGPAGGSDAEPDTTPDCPDRDGDGFADQACGGQDCDDTDAMVYPGAPEVCSDKDNDCDGQINEGLECSFYANSNSPNKLYRIDPFDKTATEIADTPSLVDIDSHPDGTLYGITFSDLYEFDDVNDSWTQVGSLGVDSTPNGLAIDTQGTAYITAGSDVYTLDLHSAAASLVGSMGSPFSSSGDCVINKDDSLYMSSNHGTGGDQLVIIDDEAVATNIGPIGHTEVYGLTFAWGRMFGLTGGGKLIEIDTGTGRGTELHTFSGTSWYGAASTPNR